MYLRCPVKPKSLAFCVLFLSNRVLSPRTSLASTSLESLLITVFIVVHLLLGIFTNPFVALLPSSNTAYETSQDMDAEEAHQLLAESRLRCLILEADKEAEGTKAVKYRSILNTLVGEDSSSVTQPEASRVLHAARGALLCRTFPAVCYPDLYRGYVLMPTWMAISRHQVQKL
jgi:hypothetical protein